MTPDIDLTDRVVDLGTEEFDLAIRSTDRHGRKIAYMSEVLGPEAARARFLGRRRESPAGVAFAASQSDPRASIVHSADVTHVSVYFDNE